MIKILELFAGIGACSKALERLNIDHKIVDAVEIDKYAVSSFNAIHGTNFEPQDITKWDKDIDVDLIMHGSPCQDFSVAGRQAGGDKDSGTRSSLMYETLRIVAKLKPKYVIWENVKNLLSKKHIHNFEAYQEAMKNLGYTNYYQVLNAKNYGVPQNRERVFTVSIRDDHKRTVYERLEDSFKFPSPIPLEMRLKDMLEDKVDEKYYLSDEQIAGLLARGKNNGGEHEISPTISSSEWQYNNVLKEPFIVASRGRNPNNPNDRAKGCPTIQRLEPKFDGTSNTITSVQKDNYLATPYRIRKLTPKECWRLMGFDDSDFEKANKVNSNTQLYKQAGNSIVVNVLEAILSNLIGGER